MEFKVFDRKSIDVKMWDKLALNGSFFHTRQWADICSSGLGHKAHSVFLTGIENGKFIIGMPAVITRKLGFKSFYSMPYGTYGEVILGKGANETQRDLFNAYLIEYLKNNRFSRIAITDFEGKLAKISEPFLSSRQVFTHIIKLNGNGRHDPPDKKINGHVRAGLKADTTEITISNRDHLDDFYKLYLMTGKRHEQRKPLYSKRFFRAILDVLDDSKMIYWNALTQNHTMIGSCINFIHNDTLFNWQTVSDYSKRHLKPNHLLLTSAINLAITKGISKINLGASPAYAHSLIDYKERWGGVRVNYDTYVSDSWIRRLFRR
ncbi:MAG TPA: GNAT family N-acetyltransferase [Candidatus Krumholzibacteriaceae bacterium]|nr:GNAT family N-acetyltransferase [Candidatus Krumholzibacteriaceae bacterium]